MPDWHVVLVVFVDSVLVTLRHALDRRATLCVSVTPKNETVPLLGKSVYFLGWGWGGDNAFISHMKQNKQCALSYFTFILLLWHGPLSGEKNSLPFFSSFLCRVLFGPCSKTFFVTLIGMCR
jgi:hypothetical protein